MKWNNSDVVDTEKAIVPLREEFKFLNDKDCPNELKILVADKITVWKHTAIQEQIFDFECKRRIDCWRKERLSELAKDAVAKFLKKNQAIYDELNAYNETWRFLASIQFLESYKWSAKLRKWVLKNW